MKALNELSHDEYLLHCLSVAYFDLLSKESREAISVSSICKKAGVSRSNYYRLFSNQNSLDSLVYFRLSFLYDAFLTKNPKLEGMEAFLGFLSKNKETMSFVFEKEEKNALYFLSSRAMIDPDLFFLPSLFFYFKEVLARPKIDIPGCLSEIKALVKR